MDNVKQARKLFSNMGFRLLIGTILMYIICYGVQFLLMYLKPEWFSNYTSSLLVAIIPQYLLAMPAMAAAIMIGMPHKAPEKRKVTFGWCILFFVISYSVMMIANYAGSFITLLLSRFTAGASSTGYAVQDFILNTDTWVMFVVMVVVGPIIEELLFRKIIIDRCGPYGEATSALVSALAFGLFHGNLQQAIYAFALGYLFALIYQKTGKIQITICIHIVVNFMGSIVATKVLDLIDYDELVRITSNIEDMSQLLPYIEQHMLGLVIYALYSMILMGMMVAGVIILIVNRRKFIPAPGEVALPRRSTFKVAVLNPGMIVFSAVMFGEIILTLFSGSIMSALENLINSMQVA